MQGLYTISDNVYYKKRFRIETFFSDQKSRGFNIHKSHLTDPQRLSRLLIASCLAYIWLVYLGALCQKERWQSRSEEHTSELQSQSNLVCRLLLEKKQKQQQ